ncbi:MAG: hypothetical protein KGI54_17545 [Pseudomonadota bacterium]|nr:hypothetical protein [Pseudomonadota bacterium]
MNVIVLHDTDMRFILRKWHGTYVCGEFEGTVREIAEQLEESIGMPVYFVKWRAASEKVRP